MNACQQLLLFGQLSSRGLVSIDVLIIVAYLVGCVLVGLFYTRYATSTEEFLLGGKALPFWAVGMSIVAGDIGATDLIAGSGAAYEYGMAQANFDWLGSMPAMVIAAFVFIPYYWRAGVYTIPEFLGRRYGGAMQSLQAVIWLVITLLQMAVIIWMSVVFFCPIMGWKPDTMFSFTLGLTRQPVVLEISAATLCIGFTLGMTGVYTVFGGLSAVVMTDVIQIIVMFVGAGALLVLGLWECGGWSGMTHAVLGLGDKFQNHFTLLLPNNTPTPYPWSGIVFGLGVVMSTAYFVGNQPVVQRALGARSEWDAKAGMLFAGFLKLFIPLLLMVPGLTALPLYPHLDRGDLAVPTMVASLLPPGLMGLMFAAFFAAMMSNLSCYLSSLATLFVSDVYAKAYQSLRARSLSPKHGLIVGRLVTVAVILLGGVMAPVVDRFPTLYVATQSIYSIVAGPMLTILMLGILWPRANRYGAMAGFLLGVCSSVTLTLVGQTVFHREESFLFVAFWSFVVAMVLTAIVSLLTPPEPAEKLRGLCFQQVLQDETAQELLRARVEGS